SRPASLHKASENPHLARDRSGFDTGHMALRQVALGLLRQRTDTVPQDADADVVKIIVHEERRIPMIVRQSVAAIAAGLGVEQFPAALGRFADGVRFSGDEMVKRRIE